MSAALAAASAFAPPDGAGVPPLAVRRRACTLLLVDDEPANLDLLEALLESEGYGAAGGGRLVRTADPREVPALAAAHAPDLVLLDLHMPHRHGLDVLADLVAATPADEYRPVLVLTADATVDARDRALALGARDFVTKPFDATEVLLRVANLLDARVLHGDERRARERAALLAEWSRVLAAALEPGAVLAQLPALVAPRWASRCTVTLDGVTAAHGAPDGPPDRLDGHTLPVVAGGEPVGTLTLAGVDADGRPVEAALAAELATRLALAAEHARLLAAAQLATAERERLLAVVAHDLRNPLGAVALYAEVLAQLQPEDDAAPIDPAARAYARAAIDTIHGSTAGMQRLVEDLLDASTLRAGALRVHRAPTPAGGPVADALRTLRPLAERAGLALHVACDTPAAADAEVALDATRVAQLLSNLVGNAIRFTPAGGTVALRWRVEPATDDAPGALAASVSDTGPGIDADALPHLFTAFWRGDRRGRAGAGLGLWIARGIVEAHGGELRVDSRPGAGTTFSFTLPFADRVARRED